MAGYLGGADISGNMSVEVSLPQTEVRHMVRHCLARMVAGYYEARLSFRVEASEWWWVFNAQ